MALRVTPVPIPNTKVKPYRADGTARAALWKSRLLPDLGQLAQSVEQRTENPRVPGSIPGLATKNVLDNSKTFFLVCFVYVYSLVRV